jgi:hypothetical protein
MNLNPKVDSYVKLVGAGKTTLAKEVLDGIPQGTCLGTRSLSKIVLELEGRTFGSGRSRATIEAVLNKLLRRPRIIT